MSKRMSPKTPAASLDEQAETAKLCSKTAAIVQSLQSELQGGSPPRDSLYQQWFKDLGEELISIEKLQRDIDRGVWPSFVNADKDMNMWVRVVHRARLAVMQVNATLVATLVNHQGWDPTVSNALAKCVSSAQTSSGDDWKKLRPVRPVKKTKDPYEAELRARIAAVGMLYRTKAARQEIYREAVVAGMSEREAKQVVRDAAAQKLKDPTFSSLEKTWRKYFQGALQEAKERGHVISIGQMIHSPYRPVSS
jgi:hypothetical protein